MRGRSSVRTAAETFQKGAPRPITKPDIGCQRQRLSFIVEALRRWTREKKLIFLKIFPGGPCRTSEAHRLP
jgi:hypothetical protein